MQISPSQQYRFSVSTSPNSIDDNIVYENAEEGKDQVALSMELNDGDDQVIIQAQDRPSGIWIDATSGRKEIQIQGGASDDQFVFDYSKGDEPIGGKVEIQGGGGEDKSLFFVEKDSPYRIQNLDDKTDNRSQDWQEGDLWIVLDGVERFAIFESEGMKSNP